MKIKRKVLSLFLTVLLVSALAVPAAARTVIQSYDYGGFGVSVSDTCNLTSFSTVIESHTDEYLLRTDVCVLLTQQFNGSNAVILGGSPSFYISFNSENLGLPIAHIECNHFVDDYCIDTVFVEAS